MDLILKVKFWIAHVKFNRMVIFQSLAQFPVDHLSQLVMPGFRFLWYFCCTFLSSNKPSLYFSPNNLILLNCCRCISTDFITVHKASMQRCKSPLASLPDMTLYNLMVSFQPWNFGEYGVPLHYHHSLVLSGPEW